MLGKQLNSSPPDIKQLVVESNASLLSICSVGLLPKSLFMGKQDSTLPFHVLLRQRWHYGNHEQWRTQSLLHSYMIFSSLPAQSTDQDACSGSGER